MASIIKVDSLQEKTSGNGIVLENSLKDSTGTNEIISPSGGITIPSGQSIKNSSGTSLVDATGTISSDMVFPAGHVVQVKGTYTDAITGTTSKSGFEAMSITMDALKSTSSKLLVIGNVYGAALDDSHAWLEYKIGSGSWTRDTNLNGAYNDGMAFGDFSVTRDLAEPDQQVGYGTSVLWSPNTIETVAIRVICSAENVNGFRLNIGTSVDTAALYNNTTAKSTLVVMEIS